MNLEIICRICLECSNQTYDIYTSYLQGNNLYSDILSDCTKLKPNEKDGLPRLICKECCRQLKKVYTFNKRCLESDQKLRIYVDNVVKSEEVNDDASQDIKIELFELEAAGRALDVSILDESCEQFDDVKTEPEGTIYGNDPEWDADDDNAILLDLKHKKCASDISEDYSEDKHKKKGKKKGIEGSKSKVPHQCDICGKFLSTRSNLKAHKICHTDLRPYKCKDCPAAFRGHSALFQHKKVHTGETPYHCEYCSKQFRRRTGLVNHIRMHTGEKMYSCEICFKNFVQSGQLSIHMKRHKGDKPFLCQDCGKGFPLKSDLTVHQRIHNGEKPYSCHLCEKTFATSGNLSIHVRIHNKEIRYKCKECQRGFVTCSAYNVHLKRHKGQRDYHCECGKTFYTSSALKQHKVVHTGEKKYQCKICDRKFTQTSHLTRHFKKDHAKPNVPIPPSDHFKLVVSEESSNKGVANYFVHKIPESENIKCEGT